KERDVAQLDGYSVRALMCADNMDLLVQYVGGEQVAATGLPPGNNKYYNAEWFIDFFRNLSGAFGKNIFTDSFQERERAERQAALAKWNEAVNAAGINASGNDTAQGGWQCSACGQLNTGPFCSECGSVKPKE
ncbi:MAG: hypothetical protein IJ056_04310, partial [Acidaminococcaceae bacterium]|nr:hypothetical protein [Acidaminococcaceae bacterium]